MGCVCDRISEKNQAKISQRTETDKRDNSIDLTEQQKCVIRNNWQVLKLDVANVGVITFVRYSKTTK